MLKELFVIEDKNLFIIKDNSKLLMLIMIFSRIFLFLGLRDLAFTQFEGRINYFFDELLLYGILDLL
jgi:hypothetical protein